MILRSLFSLACSVQFSVQPSESRTWFGLLIEPIGLDRDDGKHPDGITRFPFKSGKSLIWVAACTDTFSTGTIVSLAVNPGSASAELSKQKSTNLFLIGSFLLLLLSKPLVFLVPFLYVFWKDSRTTDTYHFP